MANVLDGISKTDLVSIAFNHQIKGRDDSAAQVFQYMKDQGVDLIKLQTELHELSMLVWEARK